MKVETLNVFGTYKKGEILDLPESTAKALIAHKAVKEVGTSEAPKEVKEYKK